MVHIRVVLKIGLKFLCRNLICPYLCSPKKFFLFPPDSNTRRQMNARS